MVFENNYWLEADEGESVALSTFLTGCLLAATWGL